MDTQTDSHLESPQEEEHLPKGIERALRLYRAAVEWLLVIFFVSMTSIGALLYWIYLSLFVNVGITGQLPW